MTRAAQEPPALRSAAVATLPGPGDITDVPLANGLRALIRENHASPTVVVDGLVHGGTLYETQGELGLANFMAEMLERGTRQRGFEALWDELEALSADIGFGAGRHTIGFDARCLAEDLPRVLSLTSEMLAAPAFPQDQIDRVRGQILTGLQQRDHDTRAQAMLAFRRLAYGPDHPYSRDPDGSADSVAAIDRDALVGYYARVIHPAGGIVAVVGDVDTARCIAWLEDTLGQWQPGAAPPVVRSVSMPPPLAETRRVDIAVPGKRQADVILGGPGIPRQHPDWLPTSLANVVLGVFGLMGRLGEEVRDRRGLAYYAYSRLTGGLGPGPWYAAIGVNPAQVEAAITATLTEMRHLQDTLVPEDELADVQAYVTGALPLQLETNDGVARAMVDMALYDLGLDHLQHYAERVRAVRSIDVQRAATRLSIDSAAISVAGPSR